MPVSSDDDDELLGLGQPAFKRNSSREVSRKESKMFSFLDRCVAEEEERCSSRIKIQKLMKEEETTMDEDVLQSSNAISAKKEDDYWERIHQETAKSTTSAKARRKRQLDDAIDGIVSCGENDDDEEYRKDRAKRLGKASAITTALSTTLGARRVFHREEVKVATGLISELTDFLPFASETDSVGAMETILSKISPKNRTEKSPINILIGLIKASISSKNLSNLLMSSTIARWSIKYETKVPLPIQSWLWKVLCSSNIEHAEGSRLTLRDILCSRIADGNLCHSGGHGLVNIGHLNLMMKYIFGFRTTKATQMAPLSEDLSTLHTCGAVRFPPMLDVWCAAFQNDAVLLTSLCDDLTNKPVEGYLSDEATKLLSSLILASIDPSFHSGIRGMSTLQQLILSVLNTILRHLNVGKIATKNTSDIKQFDLWLKKLVMNVLLQAQDLKEGDIGSADVDDFNGFLPLSLMAKSIPAAATGLRAKFSEEALKYLFKNVEDWSGKRNNMVVRRCKELRLELAQNDFPLSWKILASAELGLAYAGEMVSTCDGPQLYAIIDTAKVCAEAGRALSNLHESFGSSVYKSTKDAAYACLSFEAMENHCTKIKKGITCVFVNQHLRRSKELLTQISIYSKHMKIEAMKSSGKHHGLIKVQTTLDAWIDCEEEEESQP